jgi:hypothetical protein
MARRNIVTDAALNVADFITNLRKEAKRSTAPDIGEERIEDKRVLRRRLENDPVFRNAYQRNFDVTSRGGQKDLLRRLR